MTKKKKTPWLWHLHGGHQWHAWINHNCPKKNTLDKSSIYNRCIIHLWFMSNYDNWYDHSYIYICIYIMCIYIYMYISCIYIYIYLHTYLQLSTSINQSFIPDFHPSPVTRSGVAYWPLIHVPAPHGSAHPVGLELLGERPPRRRPGVMGDLGPWRSLW